MKKILDIKSYKYKYDSLIQIYIITNIKIYRFIISILFLIQYNCICNRLVVYKQAYDISQGDLIVPSTPVQFDTTQPNSISQKSINT